MDREIVLLGLVLLLVGPLVTAAGALPSSRPRDHSPAASERARWRAIWLPLVPVAAVLAALGGWAVGEPDNAEPLPRWVAVATAPFAAVWLRALVRAICALLQARGDAPAATSGLIAPKVAVSPALASALDPAALEAVRQHELAHARHRDPMRIWLAQLATDLQWPWPTARARFERWLHSLEIARDNEARLAGVEGADLADALLVAAKSRCRRDVTASAGVLSEPSLLEERIRRLLAPLKEEAPVPASRAVTAWALFASALGIFVLLGTAYGEAVVRTLLVVKP